jgi:hypothetical protein
MCAVWNIMAIDPRATAAVRQIKNSHLLVGDSLRLGYFSDDREALAAYFRPQFLV